MPGVREKVETLFLSLGSPLDAANVREVGWRKLRSGSTTFVVDFDAVQTNEPITIQHAPRCPLCGERMVERAGSYGTFWGCSDYPDCRGTRRA